MASRRWVDMEHEGHDITIKGGELATSDIHIHCLSRGYSFRSEGDGDSICLLFPATYSPGRMLKAASILENYLRNRGYDINPDGVNAGIYRELEQASHVLQ